MPAESPPTAQPHSTAIGSSARQCNFPFELPVGDFALSQLKNAGLLEIAEKLYFGEELETEDKIRLAVEASLPLLGILVQMRRHAAEWPQLAAVRPLICIPLAGMLERMSCSEAQAEAERQLGKVLKKVSIPGELYLISDYWKGAFELPDLIRLLAGLRSTFQHQVRIVCLGPSTVDIQAMVPSDEQSDYRSAIIKVLKRLSDLGVESVDGGTDLPVHREAASAGLQLALGQRILPIPDSEHPDQASEEWALKFCRDIDFINNEIVPNGRCMVWFPWADHSVPETAAGSAGPLGLQMLRVIALGRLLLPTIKHIRAPWSLLGEPVAHLALSFGANDLGFGAIDYRTAEKLKITRISETMHLAGCPIGFMGSWR